MIGLRVSSLSNAYINLRPLSINSQVAQKNMEKLSSGLRINRASDDAAGMAISSKMETELMAKSQAKRNIIDGIGYLQTAEGSLNEITKSIGRIRELTIEAASDTKTMSDRKKIQNEINQIKQSINNISEGSQFNGVKTIRVEAERLLQLPSEAEGRADISFIIDVSASMAGSITTVRNGLSSFVNLLAGQGVSARISVTSMANKALGNNPRGDDTDWTNTTVDLTEDVTTVTNEFNKYRLGVQTAYVDPYNSILEVAVSGKDTHAGSETGLDNIGRDSIVDSPNKRYNVKHYVVLVTDTLPEGQVGTMTGYPSPQSATRESDVANALQSTNTSVYVVGNAANISYYDGISSATGGASFTSINNATQMLNDLSVISTDVSYSAQASERLIIDKSIVRFQIGAGEGEFMELDRPHITSETLGLESYNVVLSKTSDISSLIELADTALEKALTLQTKFGSAQNRLESRLRSLSANVEALTNSQSQIKDLDFSDGIAAMTKSELLSSIGMANLTKHQDFISKMALDILNNVPTFSVN